MIKVRDVIKEFYPLRYVVDGLLLCTPMGKERLLNTSLMQKVDTLEQEWLMMEQMMPMVGSHWIEKVRVALGAIRDISTTVKLLSKGEVMSEVELFELKYLACNAGKLKVLLQERGFSMTELIDIFRILDPCDNKVVNFHIYDAYDEKLTELRKRRKDATDDPALHIAIIERERAVRVKLSLMLKPMAPQVEAAIERIAQIDLLIAKCLYTKKHSLTKPDIAPKTNYIALSNIYLKDMVESGGGIYQSVDIDLTDGPTLITGANMSGKTMLLKSVALAQYMVQFGLYAPAAKASVRLVDNVFISIGDSQHEEQGLSSFASEMLKVSHMVDQITSKGEYLVLLDELARTTSPNEGMAIVEGVIAILSKYNVKSLITTHYGSLNIKCRCKRVRGFVKEKVDCPLTRQNIGRFIDYSLVDDTDSLDKDSQAIEIARILGVNPLLISETINYLELHK